MTNFKLLSLISQIVNDLPFVITVEIDSYIKSIDLHGSNGSRKNQRFSDIKELIYFLYDNESNLSDYNLDDVIVHYKDKLYYDIIDEVNSHII